MYLSFISQRLCIIITYKIYQMEELRLTYIVSSYVLAIKKNPVNFRRIRRFFFSVLY